MSKWSAFWSRQGAKDEKTPKPKANYIDIVPEPSNGTVAKESWLARWKPLSRRDHQLSSLQAGFNEMRDLLQAIREHLRLQQDVQSRMVDVLEKLPPSMEGLKSVNKAAEQQVEVLGLLKTQMETGVQHDQQMIESMNRFNQTLGIMDETSRTSSRTVADLIEKSRESDQLLRDVIGRSERRLLTVVIAFLLALILGTGALLYLELGGRSLLPPPPPVAPAPIVAPVIPPPPTAPVVEQKEESSVSEEENMQEPEALPPTPSAESTDGKKGDADAQTGEFDKPSVQEDL